jgi:arginase
MTTSLDPNSRFVRRPIVASAHPGGRYPGVELPPTWFEGEAAEATIRIPSALPHKSDLPGIFEAVRLMGAAIRDAALAAYDHHEHPMLIGGDHSLAVGTLAAATRRFGRVGVIWVDAHADFNTMETSPSGNPHGMPLSAACGLGDERLTSLFESHVNPLDVVLIAAREIDPGERVLLDQHGVWVVTVAELREMGVPALIEAIARRLAGLPVHLSYDFDSLDESCFRATGTPSPEGLTPEEGEALVRGFARRLPLISSDWVEYDPRHEDAAACASLARRLHAAFVEELEAARPGNGGQTASCA